MKWDFTKFSGELDFLGKLLEHRINSIKKGFDISPLIRSLESEFAKKAALELLGEGEHYVLGIDGSMDHRERLEVVILYVTISGFRSKLYVDKYGEIKFMKKDVIRDDSYLASAIVPLWIEDLNQVLHQNEIGVNRSLEVLIERIPFSIMTFGEFYMGYKAISEGNSKVILFDRPFASSIHPYQRDVRDLIFREEGGFFSKFTYNGVRLSKADLLIGLYCGPNIFKIPFRGVYRLYSILQYIILNDGRVCFHELEKKFGINRDSVTKRLSKLDREVLDNTLLDEITNTEIIMNPNLLNYWERIRKIIRIVGSNIFEDRETKHPLYFEKDDAWIGSKEINTLSLFTIYDIWAEAERKQKIIVGIGKDTYVTDITRSIIPLANNLKLVNVKETPIKSDKPLLTLLSVLQPEKYKTPWRFIMYDAAFSTLVENENGEAALKAARKVVFQEKLVARTYFQLRTLSSVQDKLVKSPVFFYDRFITKYDKEHIITLNILEKNKVVKIYPLFEEGFSYYDNFILYLLSKLDTEEVAEATGHNYLLFIADKDVKTSINMVRDSVIQAAESKISDVISKRHIYVITRRFRDFRHIVESRRRR